jgi:transcriptional regulator with PAS, ATPase and Fis domain
MPKHTPRRRRLETRLLGEATPLFLVDGKRRLVFFNGGCEQLTGWRGEEVLGKTCDYAVDVDPHSPASLCGSLAPPPAVVAEGSSESVPATLVHKDGAAIDRTIHFHPLLDDAGAVDLIVGIIGEPGATRTLAASGSLARTLHAELAALRAELRRRYGLSSFIARGEAMQRVAEQVMLAKSTQSAVVISGERGTGKEHVARVIHNEGLAASRTFVPLDCERLPAREVRHALRRILQLDDPDEATRTLQASGSLPAEAALRPATVFLQSVERLGRDVQEMLVNAFRENRPRPPAGVRLLAGSAADLQQAVRDELLRSDFYFLVSALHIELPPLRDRPDDLELLGQHFLEELNRGRNEQVGEISDAVWEQFRVYQWPGNLAELRTVIEEARENCRGAVIEPRHLPFRFRTGLDAQSVGPPVAPQSEPLVDYLATVEAERIRDVLRQVRHNKTLAAKTLGMTRTRLYRRMESLGIEDLEK